MNFVKNLFYYFIKGLFRLYTPFFFKSIRVWGQDQLPSDGGILLSPNHQGAFLDPLLVGLFVPGKLYSLTRGDVFVPPYRWLFNALQMLPIFRIRNGYSSLKYNAKTFEKCYQVLGEKKKLMMFSEGLHHEEMFLYPISKGSSRLAYTAQKKNPNTPVYLVPVGINYQNYNRPWKGLQIVYGKAIPIHPYLEEHEKDVLAINAIRKKLAIGMKACLWIPEKTIYYKQQLDHLQKLDVRKDFHHIRKQLEQRPRKESIKKETPSLFARYIVKLLKLLHQIPLFITRKLMHLFKDPIFHGSVKYVCGLFVFPIWFGLLSMAVSAATGLLWGLMTCFLLIISVFALYHLEHKHFL